MSVRAPVGPVNFTKEKICIGRGLVHFRFSFPEQKSIVSRLDALSSETKKLEAIYKQKLADLDELKKSVLKKAFVGEL